MRSKINKNKSLQVYGLVYGISTGVGKNTQISIDDELALRRLWYIDVERNLKTTSAVTQYAHNVILTFIQRRPVQRYGCCKNVETT